MDKHRWIISYYNPCRPRRIAPFYVWAETEELALAYAREWVGPPHKGEHALAYYTPSSAMEKNK